jgi:hypothetical protein
MGIVESIRAKLDAQVFGKLGSTVTVTARTAGNPDKWGKVVYSTTGTTTPVVVPYNVIKKDETFSDWGSTSDGEVDVVFKHDVVLGDSDIVNFDSQDYIIKKKEKFPLTANSNLAWLVRLTKKLA